MDKIANSVFLKHQHRLKMEKYSFDKDIHVFCMQAPVFPTDIEETHHRLQALVPYTPGRRYFGISCPDRTGAISYKAAVEEMIPGEAEKYRLESFVILKGDYICISLINYFKDVTAIGKAFEQLLTHPGIDLAGYCLEWFFNEKDVRCMVRLKGVSNLK
jgi:hypothetical protein